MGLCATPIIMESSQGVNPNSPQAPPYQDPQIPDPAPLQESDLPDHPGAYTQAPTPSQTPAPSQSLSTPLPPNPWQAEMKRMIEEALGNRRSSSRGRRSKKKRRRRSPSTSPSSRSSSSSSSSSSSGGKRRRRKGGKRRRASKSHRPDHSPSVEEGSRVAARNDAYMVGRSSDYGQPRQDDGCAADRSNAIGFFNKKVPEHKGDPSSRDRPSVSGHNSGLGHTTPLVTPRATQPSSSRDQTPADTEAEEEASVVSVASSPSAVIARAEAREAQSKLDILRAVLMEGEGRPSNPAPPAQPTPMESEPARSSREAEEEAARQAAMEATFMAVQKDLLPRVKAIAPKLVLESSPIPQASSVHGFWAELTAPVHKDPCLAFTRSDMVDARIQAEFDRALEERKTNPKSTKSVPLKPQRDKYAKYQQDDGRPSGPAENNLPNLFGPRPLSQDVSSRVKALKTQEDIARRLSNALSQMDAVNNATAACLTTNVEGDRSKKAWREDADPNLLMQLLRAQHHAIEHMAELTGHILASSVLERRQTLLSSSALTPELQRPLLESPPFTPGLFEETRLQQAKKDLESLAVTRAIQKNLLPPPRHRPAPNAPPRPRDDWPRKPQASPRHPLPSSQIRGPFPNRSGPSFGSGPSGNFPKGNFPRPRNPHKRK